MHEFKEGRRYRLHIRPAGSRSKIVIREYNFLETTKDGVHLFDARPEGGTQQLPDDMILKHEDIGRAIWSRV